MQPNLMATDRLIISKDVCGDSQLAAMKQAAAMKHFGKKQDVSPLDCIKCEAVIQVFHFLNDAVLGGAGEEDTKQMVLDFCKTAPSVFKNFCDEVKYNDLWDTIYKALRDSLVTFYCYVGMAMLGCPDINTVQSQCGF
ncbi:hypothetical protein M3Y97_00728500 [Aphelenchoides bicaudatus]|nr:hypothetical protein M3Y97_00728500 [Aphelenchoides bicaudatus]